MSTTRTLLHWIAVVVFFLYGLLLTKEILFKKGGPRYYRQYFERDYKRYTVQQGWKKANTVPFRTIRLFKKGLDRNNAQAEYNIWGNLIGFVPLGILLPLAIPFFRRWWVMIPAGILVSLGYETTQLLTGLGIFDVDDLILNGTGSLAGYLMFVMGWHLARWIHPER